MKIRKWFGKKGITFFLDYYVDGYRKRESLGQITRKEAKLIMAQRQKEILEGKFWATKDYKRISFFEICSEFLKWSSLHKRSYKRDCQFVKHLQLFFGNISLYKINRKSIENYMAWRRGQNKQGGKPISKSTINKEVACLKKLFNKAIEWGKVKENPVSRIGMFRIEDKKPRFLSEEEFNNLMEFAPDPLKPIILVAVFTGMRRGEILNLTWKNVSFDLGLINVEHTKSNKAREIPMAKAVRDILWQLKKKSKSEHVFVFADKDGKPYKEAVRFWFDKAVKHAKIEDCTFHTLRHTFASNLVKANVNLKVIQELLGHSSLLITMKYAHLSPGLKEQAIEMLSGDFRAGKKWAKKAVEIQRPKATLSKVVENKEQLLRTKKEEM